MNASPFIAKPSRAQWSHLPQVGSVFRSFDTGCAARMGDEASGTGNVDQRHDLRAHGEYQAGWSCTRSVTANTPTLAT
jgi:hypothetical protein